MSACRDLLPLVTKVVFFMLTSTLSEDDIAMAFHKESPVERALTPRLSAHLQITDWRRRWRNAFCSPQLVGEAHIPLPIDFVLNVYHQCPFQLVSAFRFRLKKVSAGAHLQGFEGDQGNHLLCAHELWQVYVCSAGQRNQVSPHIPARWRCLQSSGKGSCSTIAACQLILFELHYPAHCYCSYPILQ